MMRSERFIDNVKVERGARIFMRTNLDTGPRFRFEAVCDNDDGTQWHVVVTIGGTAIITTQSFPDHVRAVSAAEALLIARFAAALADPESPA